MTRWNEVSLGEVTAHRPICYGVLKPGERDPDGVPLIRVTDINRNRLCVDDLYFISKKLSGEFKRSVLDGGEVLLSIQGTVGRVAICPNELAGANVSRTIAIISPDGRLSNELLRYWLLWRDGTFPIGGATRASLNIGEIRQLMVPLPPLDEQKRIVAKLDQAFAALDRARANAEANLASAESLFQNTLDREFAAIADDAASLPLQDAVHPDCGLSYGIVQPGDEVEEGLPIVRPVDLTQREVSLAGLKRIAPEAAVGYARTTLRGGELLLCVRGSTGTLSVASHELAGANVTRGIVPIRFDEGRVLREFAYFQFSSSALRKQVAEKTYGAALMQINIKDLRGLRFLLPDIKVQREVVKKSEALLDATNALRRTYQVQLADTINLRQSLLQAAFSGQLS